MADEDLRSLKEQVLPFRSIRNKDFSRDVRGRNKASRDKAAGTTKVNQPGGFHVNEQDTTAVLSPVSGQTEDAEESSQSAPITAASGGQSQTAQPGQVRTAAERKRPGKLSESKRIKIFCGSSNPKLCEEICKFV